MTNNQHARPGIVGRVPSAVVVLAAVLVAVFWPGLLSRRWERHVESALANIRDRAPLDLDPELLEEMANVTALYPEWEQR